MIPRRSVSKSRSFTPPPLALGAIGLLLVSFGYACGSASESGPSGCGDAPCGEGGAGVGGSGVGGSTISFGSGGAAACPADRQCKDVCCEEGKFCALGTTCAVEQMPCTNNDGCWFDSYCEGGLCIPYGVPAAKDRDETCELEVSVDAILPDTQCRWVGPPVGDPSPNHVHVMSTPVVVDFDLDSDPKTLSPSIVFTSFPSQGSYSSPGVLRVISGKDCSQQFTFSDPADATMSPSSVAVGDLDGDGRAEIVAPAHGGGLLAFAYDPVLKMFARRWRSGTCQNGTLVTPDATGGADKWSGPSIHDLDDDGKPEIVYGATVYGHDGCLRSTKLGFPAYSKGVVPVVADVDEDGVMELVAGNAIHEWKAGDWVAESYFKGMGLAAGQVAVADMGNYPLASFGNQDRPEVVVVSTGQVRVQTLEGTVVFGPFAVPGGGTSGPPTIADFDGDGRREFATAGGSQYVVFDLDCVAGGDAAKCGAANQTTGVLWAQASKDQSSNVTGSSVFDFDANGAAEAVYADECFLRIYEGATGKVIYSAARSSATTYENPVIVDVDGDYRTEIVSAVNDYAGALGCPATDPLFPMAKYEKNHGIVVLRDAQDHWAASRPVWNQHAYAVTHVGNAGESPKSSAVKLNWKDPTLNNFRQNVQGDLTALGVPDLTAGGEVGVVDCSTGTAYVEARVCNRGTLPMVSGTEVGFYEGAQNGPELCRATIPFALQAAECLVVGCNATIGDKIIDVLVLVDPDSLTEECHEQNNGALYSNVGCGQKPR
ncbi:MAG: hypothetical protein FJ095_05385 [Deltaproteobacteria bacterium]|nr:hypothetical protein [Deltaproteobacteria bacterium]